MMGKTEKVSEYRNVAGMRIDPAQAGDAKLFRTWGVQIALICFRGDQEGQSIRTIGALLRVVGRCREAEEGRGWVPLGLSTEPGGHKLKTYGGLGKDYLFLLSWTCTGSSAVRDIEVLAGMATPWLPALISRIRRDGTVLPNVAYIDFVDAYLGGAILAANR